VKRVLFVGLLAIALNSAAETLIVRSGQAITIDNNYNPIYLDALVMEDDSKVIVVRDAWHVTIKEATFGKNTLIDGSRGVSADAADNTTVPVQAKECDSGGQLSYLQGPKGDDGKDGASIQMLVGIREVKHLVINVNGGGGGHGGRGGQGRQGGAANCICHGGTGGTGGNGGSGGRGGDSGAVYIRWYPVERFGPKLTVSAPSSETRSAFGTALFAYAFPVGLEVRAEAGRFGAGGGRGPGAAGGQGHNCGIYWTGGGAGARKVAWALTALTGSPSSPESRGLIQKN